MRFVAERAMGYFHECGRDFPWRREVDPYRLAVAEILLQKTRARSIVSTYKSIVTRYPRPSVLCEASFDELETMLRPLGLSRKRAEQLVGMARAVSEVGESIFDDWRVLLADVPGLGAYGARAIACFGRGESIGIVDANVARILRRIFRIRTNDARASIYQRYADEIASSSVDPRATNFGLLDVGAAICLPKPICSSCPFVDFCPRFGVKKLPADA